MNNTKNNENEDRTIKKYNIQGVLYSKDDIKDSNELKKELFKMLKYEEHKKYVRDRARQALIEDPEKVRKQKREYAKKRYNEDPEYKLKTLQKMKERRDAIFLPELRQPRGRPERFYLDDNFDLLAVVH